MARAVAERPEHRAWRRWPLPAVYAWAGGWSLMLIASWLGWPVGGALVLYQAVQSLDEDVLRKVKGDFDAAGVAIGEQQIRVAMDELLAKAIADIRDNG
jgi:hypothetical protein